MSNFLNWAQNELNMLVKNNDGMQLAINKDIMKLLEVFANQGHTGFTAGYTIAMFNRLANWKPITPLSGEDDEWGEPYGNDNKQQNKRCPSIFRKNFDNSTAYYTEGKIFTDDGKSWYTSRDSHIPITFPYIVPDKPEEVYLNETNKNNDNN